MVTSVATNPEASHPQVPIACPERNGVRLECLLVESGNQEPVMLDVAEQPVLHLASQSARRRELLSRHGIAHRAAHPGIDDGLLTSGDVPASQWVASLAYLKAVAGLESSPELPVLGADTVCVKDGAIIGQPIDADDARRILLLLQNGSHEVVTGVAVVWPGRGRREIFVDRAQVHVGEIGTGPIETYIASGEWRGKAGAYNLAERVDAGWPIRCDGDPSTVMGLPMTALLARLQRWGATVSGGGAGSAS